MPTAYEVFFHPQNRGVTDKLIRYTFLMFGFPICTFYFSYLVLFKGDPSMLGWSGLLAVLAANVVIAAYVIMAWQEDQADMAEEAKRRAAEGEGSGSNETKTL